MIPHVPPESCPQCGAQLAPSILACPRCAWLTHGEALTALAQSAREAAARGDIPAALTSWRDALTLLPAGSKQHQVIAARIAELGDEHLKNAPAEARAKHTKSAYGAAAGVGALGLLLWKAKTLLFGLTKGTTLFSMLLSLGVYWTLWGWKFALGLVLSIYVHEMGHVIALRRYGFRATAPMFIPGFGALIRMQQTVVNAREDAAIGLAGPIYGLAAAAISLVLWLATDQPVFAAIAGIGAWINLFNLLPIGPLDGSRGSHAMSRSQMLLVAATAVAARYATGDGLLFVLALVCFLRCIGPAQEKGSAKVAVTFCLLIVALAAISTVRMHLNIE